MLNVSCSQRHIMNGYTFYPNPSFIIKCGSNKFNLRKHYITIKLLPNTQLNKKKAQKIKIKNFEETCMHFKFHTNR